MGSRDDLSVRGQVTVVIPNYNGMDFIEKCLDSILEAERPEDVPAVIVVDNASKDGSDRLVESRYPQVTLVRLPANTGFCHAVNTGILLCRTRFVMLLNNDTAAEQGCVRHLYETLLTDSRAFSVQAKMVSMKDPDVIDDAGDDYCALGWAFARGKAQPRENFGKKREIFSACAGAAMYRMSIFREIGGFDERHFCYLEDVDIGYRARIFGYRNLFEPKAVVRHFGSASSGSVHNPFKEEMAAGNNLYLLYKNMPAGQYVLNAPLILLGRGIKNKYFTKKGLGEAYNKGIARGRILCERAREWKEGTEEDCLPQRAPLPEEACLSAAPEGTETFNPLYLGGKVDFQARHLPNYIGIQFSLWAGCIRRLKG